MTAALATPYEVSGAAHCPAPRRPATLLRLEGFAGSVAHRAARARARRSPAFGPARVDEGPGDWAAIRDAAAFAGRDGRGLADVGAARPTARALGARLAPERT